MKNKHWFFSCLFDIFFLLLLVGLCGGVYYLIQSTKETILSDLEIVDDKVDSLSVRLDEAEFQLKTLGYAIETSIDEDGTALVKINGIIDDAGNVIDVNTLDNYLERYDELYKACEDTLSKSNFNYNYIKYLNSQDYMEYRVYDNGIIINSYDLTDTLEYIEIPETIDGMVVKTIAKECFKDATFSEIKIPKSISTIDDNAFSGCKNLRKVEFYSSVLNPESTTMTLGMNVFKYCEKLTSIKLPDSVIYLGEQAFAFCHGLEKVELSDNIENLYYNTFYQCYAMTEISLPANLKTISVGCFQSCSSLQNIELPTALKTIGNNAFAGCSSLTSVYIPDSVNSIATTAFINCNNLATLSLPAIFAEADYSVFGAPSTCEIIHR